MPSLFGEGIEHFSERFLVFLRRFHLPLLDHCHEFNRGYGPVGRIKVFAAQYRARISLDVSVVLHNDVIRAFALTDFIAFVMVFIKLFQARVIGSTLINIDQTRLLVFIKPAQDTPSACWGEFH
ncbi:MAG: hypothetical protein R3B95_10035 [Nitrospirales bacterium]|nr:hypothetical protein [Nitrospirales bacterium]